MPQHTFDSFGRRQVRRICRNEILEALLWLAVPAGILCVILPNLPRVFADREATMGEAIVVICVLGAMMLWQLWLMLSALYYMVRYTRHRAYRRLAQSEFFSAQEVDAVITSELERPPLFERKGLIITRYWVIVEARRTVTVRPRGQLERAQGRKTRHYYRHHPLKSTNIAMQFDATRRVLWYRVLVGTAHAVTLRFRDGLELPVHTRSRRETDSLLSQLTALMPQLNGGFCEDEFIGQKPPRSLRRG